MTDNAKVKIFTGENSRYLEIVYIIFWRSGGIFPECSPTRDNYVYIISRASIASKARIVIAVR